MSSTQEPGLAAVPSQGRPVDAVAASEGNEAATQLDDQAAAAKPDGESAPEPAAAPEATRARSRQVGARQVGARQGSSGRTDEPRRRPAPPQKQPRAQAPAYDPEPERMPLMARVLLGDLAVAVVGLVALFVIEVQRFGDSSLSLRRRAWHEDLVALFVVTAIFGVVTFLLARARHTRVFIVQAIVTALVLTAAITSAATGSPKLTPTDPVTTTTPGHPG